MRNIIIIITLTVLTPAIIIAGKSDTCQKRTVMDMLTTREWKRMDRPNEYIKFDSTTKYCYSLDTLTKDTIVEKGQPYYLASITHSRATYKFDTTRVGTIKNGNYILFHIPERRTSPKGILGGREFETESITIPVHAMPWKIIRLDEKFLVIQYPHVTGSPWVRSYKAFEIGDHSVDPDEANRSRNHEYEERTMGLLTAHEWENADNPNEFLKFTETSIDIYTYSSNPLTGEMNYDAFSSTYYLASTTTLRPPLRFEAKNVGKVKGGEYIVLNRKVNYSAEPLADHQKILKIEALHPELLIITVNEEQERRKVYIPKK